MHATGSFVNWMSVIVHGVVGGAFVVLFRGYTIFALRTEGSKEGNTSGAGCTMPRSGVRSRPGLRRRRPSSA